MKTVKTTKQATQVDKKESAMKARGLAAAKAMSKMLREEHRRWNMPLLTWKKGQVVKVKP